MAVPFTALNRARKPFRNLLAGAAGIGYVSG